MKTFDVVIIGAGLAGLQCAKLLSRQGAKILLVDRKTDLTKGVHTTGIFVRKTLEDFDWSFNASIHRKEIFDLATGNFIRQGKDVLFLGPPGV